jgi:branched-chain amino acid transport system permease protein
LSATETPPPSAPKPVSVKPRSPLVAKLTAPTTQKLILPIVFLGLMALVPLMLEESSPLLRDATLAAAYVVMALGLNIIVGFAGLLDLGYVAFFAIGAYTIGWFGSGFFADANGGEGIHVAVSGFAASLPGLHFNFLIILVFALIATTIAGMIIGLPTLRLRGDYIAIVTLAFGEIIGDIAENGDRLSIGEYKLTNGKQGITPVDKIDLPFVEPFQPLGPETWYFVALALVALVLFRELPAARLATWAGWTPARGRGGGVEHGQPAREDQAARPTARRGLRRHVGAFLGSYSEHGHRDQFSSTSPSSSSPWSSWRARVDLGRGVGAVALSFIINP